MTSIDRNFEFLLKCKKLANQRKLKQLIIPDRHISPNSLLSYEQIMVSQYASALQDQLLSPFNFKNTQHYSLPIAFALIQKSIKQGNAELADRIISHTIREQPASSRNRHILSYNKVKMMQMQGNYRKATVYCQGLLKQSGDGCDYYTYQFLILLISQGRMQQAFKIAERHLQNLKFKQKHKIQSVYIYLLSKVYQKDEAQLFKKIQKIFNNSSICIRNVFNIALLLRHRNPQKSLQLFTKIAQIANNANDEPIKKIIVLSKINILNIYKQVYLNKSRQGESNFEKRQIVQKCLQLADEIQKYVEVDDQFVQARQQLLHQLNQLNNKIKNQNNFNFFHSIADKSGRKQDTFTNQYLVSHQLNQIQSQAENSNRHNKNVNQLKYFQEKRAENEKRLKFLLKKQKQLKKFFERVKIEKNGSKLNIKVIDRSLINQISRSSQSMPIQEIQLQENKFEEKKKKLKIIYEEGEINSIINNFIYQWVIPYQKSTAKVKNVEKMQNFVISLQLPNNQLQNNPYRAIYTTRTRTAGKAYQNKTNTQSFRVKNNISRKNSEKLLNGLKNNDHISNQILLNLKNNMTEKKRQQKFQAEHKKSFKQLLHQGQILSEQNKFQQAHEHYAQMYKRFKEDRQKQLLLLKIAGNFEKLQFTVQAEKTYTKCTKYNNTQAFFRLGSLQIRNGKIQIGIENLQKANCIDRHNVKIEIQLIYAYSLLEQTTQRALALANLILKRSPQCIQALIMSSKILQKKGKLKQALDIALAIGNNCPSSSTFHYIGLLYLNDSNVSEAFKYFHKAIQCEANHYPSLIQLATIISEAKPQQAIQILKNVISQDPTNLLAFARLGKIYQTFQNDYENALLIYKKGLEYSQSYQNYIKIGDCQLKLGSIVQAYLSYKQALAIKKTPQIYEKIGQVHQIQHQDKKAIQVYMSALAQLPKDNSCFSKRKKYLFKLGKLSLANQQFDIAYNHLHEAADMEENFQIYKLLGQACFGKGDYNQALQFYQKATAMQPEDNLQLLESIAMCFDKQQQYLISKEIYQKIISIDPKNIKCLNNLANILLILGKTNEAFYWFEFMLQQIPTSIEKRLRVSDIYATIGDWSKVEQHLMICYKQKENDIRVIERMVNLYKEKRDTKQLNKFQKRLALIKSNSKGN